MNMKKITILIFVILSQFVLAQKGNFGKLFYTTTDSMGSEDVEGMRKIIFDGNDDNIVIINKIPNQALPNLSNEEYQSGINKDNFLLLINEMANKTIEVKKSDLLAAQITSDPIFVFTGKIYLTTYTILNTLKNKKQEIREIYLTIPNKDYSYLIISTSYQYSPSFAKKFQIFLDSLELKK